MILFFLAQALISWRWKAHVPTSQTPSISTKVPAVACTITMNAGRVKGRESNPLKPCKDGIITTAIEIVFRTRAIAIVIPCWMNLRLNFATDTPTANNVDAWANFEHKTSWRRWKALARGV
jgi:hypothetical protein